ncbi:MAG: hypothetical protein B7C24_17250 [Bacteroidetes bacterium 4572_77]|nr:MAG: hypothetical protein B7C24_17250 [Bacteroidetes bacterium 4572_77]
MFGYKWEIRLWRGNHRYQEGLLLNNGFDIGISLDILSDATPIRCLSIGNEEFDLSKNFTDLHTESYKQILAGNGFGIESVRR